MFMRCLPVNDRRKLHAGLQGLYTEMKFERPSRIQALTLPMILTAPYRSLIAQVSCASPPKQPMLTSVCIITLCMWALLADH